MLKLAGGHRPLPLAPDARALGLALLLIASGSWFASTASAQTDHTFESWTAALLQMRLDPKAEQSPALWLDLHTRRGEGRSTFLVRPGFGWHLHSAVSLWAGYLWNPTLIDGAANRVEHRPWQQLQISLPGPSVSFLLRSRFEQRWVEGNGTAGFRARQLARAQLRVTDDWAAVLWDEIFVALNDTPWGQSSGLDQNRLFLGAAWMPVHHVRIEPGYLMVWIPRTTGDTIAHALSLNFFVTH
ncbi:MAG: DUF2490 domain-containing protein [Myxococcales bacterium]|nr:DUF2490 domain-containing protein [Myxococcales bacterium]